MKVLKIGLLLLFILTLGACYDIPQASENPGASDKISFNHDLRQITYTYQRIDVIKPIDFYLSDVHQVIIYKNGQSVSQIDFDIKNQGATFHLELRYVNHKVIYDIILDFKNVVVLYDHNEDILGYAFKTGNLVNENDLVNIVDAKLSWYEDASYETPADLTNLSGNCLYAMGLKDDSKWLKLSLITNSDLVINDIYLKSGSSVDLPIISRVGYQFLGWFDNDLLVTSDTIFTSSTALEAKWQINSYQVTLIYNTPAQSNETLTIEYNQTIGTIIDPVYFGYEFNGWYVNNELIDLTTFKVTSDVVLIAKFSATVTYQIDFIDENLVSSFIVAHGSFVTEISVSKIGHNFLGWFAGDTKFDFNQPVYTNIELNAKWEIKSYQVTLIYNTPTQDNEILTIEYNQTIGTIIDPVYFGYEFNGWYVNNDLIDLTTFKVTSDVVLIAKFSATITYQIDFVDEDIVSSFIVAHGSFVAEINVSKLGHNFLGWFAGDTKFDFNQPVYTNIKLNAKWEIKSYQVKLVYALNEEISFTVSHNNKLDLTNYVEPSRDGHLFLGWYLIDELVDLTTLNVTADLILVARFSDDIKHQVSFFDDELISTQTVFHGSYLAHVSDLTKEGYNFIGWFNDTTRFDFSSPVTANLILQAKWEIKKYQVTLLLDENDYETVIVEHNNKLDSTDHITPSREGHYFLGWYLQGSLVSISDLVITSDISLSARWELKYYNILCYTDEMRFLIRSVYHNHYLISVEVPMREGYDFRGWSLAPDRDEWFDFNQRITSDFSIYARFEVIMLNVIFVGVGILEEQSVPYGSDISYDGPTPTKLGYEFTGWDKSLINIKNHLVIFARFEIIIYKINYNLNGGEVNLNRVFEYTVDDNNIMLQGAYRGGYEFIGWFEGGTYTNYINTSKLRDYNLVAYFQAVSIVKHEVTFYGADDEIFTQYQVVNGQRIVDPGIVYQTGHYFVGWYLNDQLYNFDNAVTKDLVIVAKFMKNDYTITIIPDNNGNTFYQYYLFNDLLGAPDEPSKEGYYFKGWYSNGSLVTFPVNVTSDMTLLAKWEIKHHVVAFNYNLPDVMIEEQLVGHNHFVYPPKPTQIDGYIIEGWLLNGEVFDFNTTPITSDITLDAVLAQITYYIVFDHLNGDITVVPFTISSYIDSSLFPNDPLPPSEGVYLDFLGWYDNTYQAVTSVSPGVSHNIYLKAVWSVPFDFSLVTIDDVTGYMITGFDQIVSQEQHLVLPDSYLGVPVIALGSGMFYAHHWFETVMLPANLIEIGVYSFANTRITEITLPQSLKYIRNYAFYSSKLQNIVISDNVVEIGDSAFMSSYDLESAIIGDSVLAIGEHAFASCFSLAELKLSKSLTTIGDFAFSQCISLETVETFENLIAIGAYAFSFNLNLTTVILTEGLEVIGTCAFNDCSKLKFITLPDSINVIGESAFAYCSELESVTIPKNLKTISPSAFYYCVSLSEVFFSEGLEVIGVNAFNECKSLVEAKLPSSLKIIDPYAFKNCVALAEVTFNDGLEMIGSNAFELCISLIEVNIPNSVVLIEAGAFSYCEKIKTVVLDGGFTLLDTATFSNCYRLEEVVILAPVTQIADNVFSDCVKLNNIIFPETLISIAELAFYNNESLTDLVIPASVKYISDRAFFSCYNLMAITFENNEFLDISEYSYGFGYNNDMIIYVACNDCIDVVMQILCVTNSMFELATYLVV